MYSFKSKRQVTYQPKRECADFRLQQSKENPQVLGLALTLHHDTRNKKLVNLLNAQNLCIPYSRVLFLETALANAVVENTKKFDGLFIPPFLKKGTFVFFAVDNTDFTEDTADGKCTTHGTITAIYQKAEAPGESLTVSSYHTAILPCNKPKHKPTENTGRIKFAINKRGVADSYKLTHLGWVLTSVLSRIEKQEKFWWIQKYLLSNTCLAPHTSGMYCSADISGSTAEWLSQKF